VFVNRSETRPTCPGASTGYALWLSQDAEKPALGTGGRTATGGGVGAGVGVGAPPPGGAVGDVDGPALGGGAVAGGAVGGGVVADGELAPAAQMPMFWTRHAPPNQLVPLNVTLLVPAGTGIQYERKCSSPRSCSNACKAAGVQLAPPS
jgi:hypothetical protein